MKSKSIFLAACAWAAALPGFAAVMVKPVPWDPTNLTSPHTVVVGTVATLTATVVLGGSTDAFTYQWNFGDGNMSAVNPVTNSGNSATVGDINNLSATHTYAGASGTGYTAVLTVTDKTNPATYTGNYYIAMQSNTLAARVNQAIDGGLWYLHITMERGTATDPNSNPVAYGGWDGAIQGCRSGIDCLDSGGLDATNVQAFEVSGHYENGPSVDPYTDDVARSLARVMQFMTPYANNGSAGGFGSGQKRVTYNPAIYAARCSDGTQPNYIAKTCTTGTYINYNPGASSCTAPPCAFTYDGNGNGQILIESGDGVGDAGYQTGMLVTAIVASGNPAGTAKLGAAGSNGPPKLPGVFGQTYMNIVQDLIDGIGYCQYYADNQNSNGADNGGGWEYHCAAVENPNYTDNSPSQWNAIGIIAANRSFGISIPAIVTDTNQVWVTWDQCMGTTCTSAGLTPGEFGYDAWTDPVWGPWAVTPSGMVQFDMDGVGRTAAGAADQRWNLTENYYRNNFCSTGMGPTTNPKLYTYGLFSFTKALENHAPGGVLSSITFLANQPSNTNPIDWYGALSAANGGTDPCDGVAQTLVARQNAAGYWYGVDYYGTQYYFETAWSVLMLNKTTGGVVCVTNLGAAGKASTRSSGPLVTLNWTGIPTASMYQVQRATAAAGPYNNVGAPTPNIYFNDQTAGLVNGNTYFYQLQPLNANAGAICTSNIASATIP